MHKNLTSEKKKTYDELVSLVETSSVIEPELFDQYNIKRGLRNKNGTGVLVGLTRIASVIGYTQENEQKVPKAGELYYRGIQLQKLVAGFQGEGRLGYEETIYLLLFGNLPTADQLTAFQELLDTFRQLPAFYMEDVILKTPSPDIMNKLQRSVLSLYSYDEDPDNTRASNVLIQALNLIAKFPMMMTYCYQAKRYYTDKKTLIIHQPIPGMGTAETILSLLREDRKYHRKEVELLDLLLVVHAEHGGGNNSAFSTHVVSSSGTDTYSAIAAALGSLKGPKHGGAALAVSAMFEDAQERIEDLKDDDQVAAYVDQLLAKEAYDQSGLVYGMGHAIYTVSDPRAVLLREKAVQVAQFLGEPYVSKLDFLIRFEEIAGKKLQAKYKRGYPLAANVDFYSGFVYQMLGFSKELYTALFATSRIAGWCAHRIEQLADKKIIRPGYITLGNIREYIPLEDRD